MTSEGRSSSHTPAVSVIIPTYNREAFLPEAIDSVLGQTWKDLETIVVDDGSTDGSQELVRDEFPEARLIVNAENEGFAAGANAGIETVIADGGDYALLMNNDTEIDRDAVA